MVTTLPDNIIVGEPTREYEGYELQWTDYPLTIVLRGREYRIGTLTEYPSGYALVLREATMRTSTAFAAWASVARALGCEPVQGQCMYSNVPLVA